MPPPQCRARAALQQIPSSTRASPPCVDSGVHRDPTRPAQVRVREDLPGAYAAPSRTCDLQIAAPPAPERPPALPGIGAGWHRPHDVKRLAPITSLRDRGAFPSPLARNLAPGFAPPMPFP